MTEMSHLKVSFSPYFWIYKEKFEKLEKKTFGYYVLKVYMLKSNWIDTNKVRQNSFNIL